MRVKGVYVIDLSSKGTTSNAVLMGLGSTRRILLADTLLAGYTQEEIEVVIARTSWRITCTAIFPRHIGFDGLDARVVRDGFLRARLGHRRA